RQGAEASIAPLPGCAAAAGRYGDRGHPAAAARRRHGADPALEGPLEHRSDGGSETRRLLAFSSVFPCLCGELIVGVVEVKGEEEDHPSHPHAIASNTAASDILSRATS